jgi:cobalt-zinc-cadmium efflux system outer membrane protein
MARYSLKFAQVTPVPDVEIRADIWKENTIPPFQTYLAATVSIPFPIWDKNRGNILAAASALVRASEGPHAVEVSLTSGLAAAYAPYKANLAAVEYYRRNILPDQVNYYRGVFERRKIDPGAAFSDLVTAQQTLVADVTAYLGVLGSLWTSVVGVADFLQTDDLYQLAKPLELPQLPDFGGLHDLPCPHPQLTGPPAEVLPTPTLLPHAGLTAPPAPEMPLTLGQRIARPTAAWVAALFKYTAVPGRSPGDPNRGLPVPELPSGASTSVAIPPVTTPPGPPAPVLPRRPGTASL